MVLILFDDHKICWKLYCVSEILKKIIGGQKEKFFKFYIEQKLVKLSSIILFNIEQKLISYRALIFLYWTKILFLSSKNPFLIEQSIRTLIKILRKQLGFIWLDLNGEILNQWITIYSESLNNVFFK